MRLDKLQTKIIGPAKTISPPDELLSRADAIFRDERSSDLGDLIAQKLALLRHFDVLHMDRLAAILCWGRSGSLLLSSYLDGHEDVITIPEIRGSGAYEFYDSFPSLPLRSKLLGYAAFESEYPRFFDRDFAISPSHYYAAVEAILELYSEWPAEFLESRRAFVIFLHIAYNLALGRRTTASPLIVYAQHVWSNETASCLLEDFPQAKFIHTVRDPLSSYNSLVRMIVEGISKEKDSDKVFQYALLGNLTCTDRPQGGMECRTRTVRLEDLHRDPAGTMSNVCDWLGLEYGNTLLESTFNGIPYVVKRNGTAWSGRNLEQTRRQAADLTGKDRALLYALFYENFVEWNYPGPKILGNGIVRCLVTACLFAIPLRTELMVARVVAKHRILPALGKRKFSYAIKSVVGLLLVRVKFMWIFSSVVLQRSIHQPRLLQVYQGEQERERQALDAELATGGE